MPSSRDKIMTGCNMCDKAGNHRKYGHALYLDGHVTGFRSEDRDDFGTNSKTETVIR